MGDAVLVVCLVIGVLLEPRIADRITVIWIGGDTYPNGGFEYNLHNDIHAASVVFRSKAELWQVPKPVYITMKVSFFELLNHVYPCGAPGKYLVEHTMHVAREHARMMEDTSTPLGSRFLQMIVNIIIYAYPAARCFGIIIGAILIYAAVYDYS